MIDSIARIWRPELYHGNNKYDKFFEGWYYKNVSENGTSILSVIPGIIKSTLADKQHAFIQFIDGITRESHYIKFDTEQFQAVNDRFEIKIGNCFFSQDRIFIDIQQENFRAFGELNFKGLTPWSSSLLSPGVMGRYSFVPFMECNHGIISLNHRTRGKLLINKNIYLFTYGKGYIEKDWGKSFPSSYIWLQSNNFDIKDVSLFCSIAKIPWIGGSFRGFIAGLYIGGKLYKFATYNGAKLGAIDFSKDKISFCIRHKSHYLTISASRVDGGLLSAPYDNMMNEGRVKESLLSNVEVLLEEKSKKGLREIFKGSGKYAGLEIVGITDEITE